MKIHLLHHNVSFHPSFLPFSFCIPLNKVSKSRKKVSIDCCAFCLLRHMSHKTTCCTWSKVPTNNLYIVYFKMCTCKYTLIRQILFSFFLIFFLFFSVNKTNTDKIPYTQKFLRDLYFVESKSESIFVV